MTPVMPLVQKMEHAIPRNNAPQLHMIFDIILMHYFFKTNRSKGLVFKTSDGLRLAHFD